MVVGRTCGGAVHIELSAVASCTVSSSCGSQRAFCGGLSSLLQTRLWELGAQSRE